MRRRCLRSVDTSTSLAVSGRPVTFVLNGAEPCTGTTNASGDASCSITPGEAAGLYTLAVSFVGESSFDPSATSALFTVTKEETTTAYTGANGPILNGSNVTLSGLLQDDGTTAISGRKRSTLTFGAQSCTATTTVSGSASCTVTVTQRSGPGSGVGELCRRRLLQALVGGTSTLVYEFAPGGGAFVVGDGSATGAVTFWGAQWSKLNSVGGGLAPSAFKGFAANPAVLGCDTAWATDPGNGARHRRDHCLPTWALSSPARSPRRAARRSAVTRRASSSSRPTPGT